MKKTLRVALLSLSLTLPFSSLALAQTREQSPAWRSLVEQQGGTWVAEWSGAGEQITTLRGEGRPLAGKPAVAARSFLATHSRLFGLNAAGPTELRLVEARKNVTGTDVFFEQTYRGLRVFNAPVDVHLSAKNEVFLVKSAYALNIAATVKSTQPKISASRAADLALAAARGAKLDGLTGHPLSVAQLTSKTGKSELGVQITKNGARLAYKIEAGPVDVVLDANTGAILDTVSVMHFATGSGVVFNPNPVQTLGNTSLRDNNDTNYAALNSAYRTATLLGIQNILGFHSLIGPHFRAMNFNNGNAGACGTGIWTVDKPPPTIFNLTGTASFNFRRHQSGFEHTNAYFHIDRSQRYIQSLGIGAVWNSAIRVDAHAISDANAFYCGRPVGAGLIAFGNGGVDTAEDAEVVLHEYGHALQDAASRGRYNGREGGAMGEGFGDYWAHDSFDSGRFGLCVAEWFGEGTCLRRLDRNKVYPRDMRGQVHADGEIWSQGLAELRRQAGRTVANRLILTSHTLIPASPTFSNGLDALLDADTRLYRGANKDKICSSFVDRGITSTRCGIWVRMSWNVLGADIDLHIRPPAGANNNTWNYSGDVAYYNTNPNWGNPNSRNDDPRLHRDCITTCNSEQITANTLAPGTYRVMAHYYAPHGRGNVTATIEVLRGSTRLFQGSRALSNSGTGPSTGQVWFAYNLVVSATGAVTIASVDRIDSAKTDMGGALAKKAAED
jgi:hypothetical protein